MTNASYAFLGLVGLVLTMTMPASCSALGEEVNGEIENLVLDQLQGRWVLKVFETRDEFSRGVILPETYDGELVIVGKKATLSLDCQGTKTIEQFQIHLDAKKNPMFLDRHYRGKNGGIVLARSVFEDMDELIRHHRKEDYSRSVVRSICEINQNTMRWCYSGPDEPRPGTFEKGTCQVWQRKTDDREGEQECASGATKWKQRRAVQQSENTKRRATGSKNEGQQATELVPGSDLDQLQGEWVLKMFEFRDDYVQSNIMREQHSVKLSISGVKATYCRDVDGEKTDYSYRIELDPKKNPRWLDCHMSDNRVYRGIYEMDGNTLRRCYGRADGPRPTTFDRGVYSEWKRMTARQGDAHKKSEVPRDGIAD